MRPSSSVLTTVYDNRKHSLFENEFYKLDFLINDFLVDMYSVCLVGHVSLLRDFLSLLLFLPIDIIFIK